MTYEFRIDKAVRAAEVLGCHRFCDISGNPSATAWLEKLEQVGRSARWTDNQKFEIAKFLLSDNVRAWWDGEERRNPQVMSWNEFKAKFLEMYYTPFHRTQEMCQFMTLDQGDQSVNEYLSQLYDAARSMGTLKDAPEVLGYQFVEGLRPSVRSRLVVLPNASLSDLAQLAMQQEEFEQAYQTSENPPSFEKKKKKGFWGKLNPFKNVGKQGQSSHNLSPAKRGNSSGSSGGNYSGRQSFSYDASRLHLGRQSFQGVAQARPNFDRSQSMRVGQAPRVCYGCRQTGHFVRDYPFGEQSAMGSHL